MLAIDLFCGGGGTCLGLQQAGFTVIGIDLKRHKNYPGIFVQADIHALPLILKKADLIIASPPCQAFSPSSARWRGTIEYPNLIPITRKLLQGHPYTVIENVPQAPIRQDLVLWGPQFGLGPTDDRDGLWRKRAFELSFFAWQLPRPKMDRSGCYATIAGTMSCSSTYERRKAEGKQGSLSTAEGKEIMGYPKNFKITRRELVESVPPAYARYIGSEALARMKEAGYRSKFWQERVEWAESLTEPPFLKGRPKKK